MRNRIECEDIVEFLVAEFGQGRLVQSSRGRYELHGGTRTDLLEAREWASLFLPEAVVRAPVLRSH